MIITYRCEKCNTTYHNIRHARACENQPDPTPTVQVGDIVEAQYGFGWFDGKRSWVINPGVDVSVHGFGPECSYGFFYVVTYIEVFEHRVRYHLYTDAMTGAKGYQHGYTYDRGHRTPKKIGDPPQSVVEESKKFIGLKSDRLF